VATPKQTVLLIDDDEAVLDSMEMLLQLSVLDVECAQTGFEALEKVKSGFSPDIIVTDYRLPGLKGIELVREIRKALNTKLTAIIASGEAEGRLARTAGLQEVAILPKPTEAGKLIALIGSLAHAG